MRSIRAIVIIALLATAILSTGCKKKPTETTTPKAVDNTTQNDTKAAIKGTIGVSMIISHPALDAVEKGLKDELAELGYTGLTFDSQNANGEMATATSIANKFKTNKVLVSVGITTPMALALANSMKDIPIVFSAVTDPIDAGLRTNLISETSNITGVSDMNPVAEQIKLATLIKPVKRVGFIYNAGEANSIVTLKEVQYATEALGIELISTTVNNTAEVKQATEIVAPKVDIIYVSTDNVVFSALNSVVPTATKYKVPVISAVPDSAAGTGVIASYGVNYYKAGRATGKMIAQILEGENPGNIPVKFLMSPEELELYFDADVAKALGIDMTKENLIKLLNK